MKVPGVATIFLRTHPIEYVHVGIHAAINGIENHPGHANEPGKKLHRVAFEFDVASELVVASDRLEIRCNEIRPNHRHIALLHNEPVRRYLRP